MNRRKSEQERIWKDNSIQFPRLIAEIFAVGLSEDQWYTLLMNMDLESDQLSELFDRAEAEFEKTKARLTVKRRV